ncbi:MAG: TolC family protein [Bacteroidetes bacterium]|nr:TolC family protein [Bacteroidota bacterium]
MRSLSITIIFLLTVLSLFGQSAEGEGGKQLPLSLSDYLSRVSKGNLGYIAEQFNVSVAEAQLKAARVFPDPEISIAYSNNEDKTMLMGQGIDAGVSYPFSLGNKRGANVSLAKSQKELAQSALDAYFQNMRAEATISYFAAIRQKNLFRLQTDIYNRLRKLAEADSLRLKVGAINATDALQTTLEARSQKNQVYQAEADFQASLTQLAQLQGKISSDTLLLPSGDFPLQQKVFNLSKLIQSALERRSDLQVAIRNKEISEKQMRLIRANRAFEFSLNAGYAHSTVVKNEIAPAPAFNSYSAGITIPLKFSGLNRGALQAAKSAVSQSETVFRDAQLQITSEVTQAWFAFTALEKQLLHYQTGLVDDAAKILEARTYAYQRGETGLIELLNAQHTYSNLQVEYYDTLYKYTEALVFLEKAAGIWDIG